MIRMMAISPNDSRVLLLFGEYRGTVTRSGFFWVNPFYSKKKVSLRGAVRGDYRGAFAAASHRWEDPAIPDHSGEQIARAQQYLRSHPSVEYFWFDFWSMPQCAFDDSRDASTGELVHFGCKRDDRTPEEKDDTVRRR